MDSFQNHLRPAQDRFVVGFLGILTGWFVVMVGYCFMSHLEILGVMIFFPVFINITCIILIVRKMMQRLQDIFFYYIFLFLLVLVICAFFLLQNQLWTPCLWFFVIPLGTCIFIDFKTAFLVSILCLFLFLGLLLGVSVFPIRVFIPISPDRLQLISHLTIAAVCSLYIYMLFAAWRLEAMRVAFNQDRLSDEEKNKESEKYHAIYNRVIAGFEIDKIHENPDLTMSELADRLETNISYIYRALKQHGEDMNFSNFVNRYRIKSIKQKIDEGQYNQYTIGYLYQTCGFKYQSTFNKIFKQFEGITPSEYIALRKSKEKRRNAKQVSHPEG